MLLKTFNTEIKYKFNKNNLGVINNMPVVTVEASKELTKEQKKEMIEKVSQVVSAEYGLPIQTITMVIRENTPDNIGVAGKPVSGE